MKNLSLLFIAILLLRFSSLAQESWSWQNMNQFSEFEEVKQCSEEISDSNVSKLSYYPLGSCRSVFVDSPHVYISNGNAMDVLSFSGKFNLPESNLIRIGRFLTEETVSVYSVINGYAFITIDSEFKNDEIKIVDVRNPYYPLEISSLHIGKYIYDVFVNDSLLFVSTKDSTLLIYNISNPNTPTEINNFSPGHRIFRLLIEGNYCYAIYYDKLYIIDVSDPTNLLEIGSFQNNNLDEWISDLSLVGKYVYLAIDDNHSPFEPLKVIDVNDPSNPIQVGSYWDNYPATRIVLSDKYAFMSVTKENWTGIPITVVDISDPTQPYLVNLDYVDGRGGNLFLLGDHLFVTTEFSLKIINVRDPLSLNEIGFYDTGYLSDNIHIKDDFAFIVPGWASHSRYHYVERNLKVFDISNSYYPVEIANHTLSEGATALSVYGSYAYVTSLNDSHSSVLEIINIDNPSYPVLLSTYPSNIQTTYQDLYASENYVYITNGQNDVGSLSIINVSDPLNPFEQGVYNAPGYAGEIIVEEDYAYFFVELPSINDIFLHIVDVSDPSNPVQTGIFQINSNYWANDLFKSGNYIYLALRDELIILDVGDPSNPIELTSYNFPDGISELYIENEYLYAICNYTLIIFDIKDPAVLIEVASYNLAGNLYVVNGRIYLLTSEGLYILQFDLPSDVNPIVNNIPQEFYLTQNYPNPFNPTTKIKYSISQLSQVQIRVFDILGNEIETLVYEEKPAGTYELTWDAENLPSGVYFYQLRAGDFIQTNKMILLK